MSVAGLEGRGVVVTGGASGIGAAIVAALARAGARPAILDLDREAGEATAAATGAAFVPVDLTDTAALRAAVVLAAGRVGPVRGLVNNAANDRRHALPEVEEADWDASQAANIRHHFFAAQAVHPLMRDAGGGSVVNLTSVAFMGGAPDMVPYATAKAAVIGLTTSLARAWGSDGIRVNAVAPGAVMTPRQMRLWHTPESRARLVARQALPVDVTEDHVAGAVLFLLGDAAAGITKQCIVVDGGLL